MTQVNLDINKVIAKFNERVAALTSQNIVLETQVEQLTEALEEIEGAEAGTATDAVLQPELIVPDKDLQEVVADRVNVASENND